MNNTHRVQAVVAALTLAGCGSAAPSNIPPPRADTTPFWERDNDSDESDEGDRADPDPIADPYEFSYQIAYENCGYDVAQLFAEAGTSDPHAAAAWYGETAKPGPHRDGAVAGCLAAVLDAD